MGVLILAGFGVVVATLVHRAVWSASSSAAIASATLGEPPGTRVGGLAASGDRLALLLQGGGPDRLVLLDARDGSRVGTITISGPVSDIPTTPVR